MTETVMPLLAVLAQTVQTATQPAAGGGVTSIWQFMGQLGGPLALGLAGLGSSVGIGIAGRAAAGAWSKEAKAGVGLRFTYIILLGLPLSQTLYGMIVMSRIRAVLMKAVEAAEGAQAVALSGPTIEFCGVLLAAGIAVGIVELFSAWMQGSIGAAGIRAISEGEGKGFVFIIIAMGIVETVGVFAMVFTLGLIPSMQWP